MRDEAAAPLHLGDDEVGHAAPVEAVGAVVADDLEGAAEVRLAQHAAGDGGRAVGQEAGPRGGEQRQARALVGDRLAPVLVHHEAVAREADRRLDSRWRREADPELPVCLDQAGHRAGHACRQMSGDASLGRLAVFIEVHVAAGARGGGLAVVESLDRAVAESDDHEPAAAEVAGLRMNDGQGKADRDGRVHRVAPPAQDSRPTSLAMPLPDTTMAWAAVGDASPAGEPPVRRDAGGGVRRGGAGWMAARGAEEQGDRESQAVPAHAHLGGGGKRRGVAPGDARILI